MDDIFSKEEKIITVAEELLASNAIVSETDAELYGKLLDEYRKLLKQMRSMVKLSDIMQRKLNSMTGELEKLSNIDELTGLYNRRFFNDTYQKEWNNAVRMQSPVGILMADIDYFKKYNDKYGHLQGDKCLQRIASSIKEAVKRPRDLVARFGGEEFIVLLPDTDLRGCVFVAGRILTIVEALDFPGAPEASGAKVSVSVGIASAVPENEMKLEALVLAADKALYRAKEDGRNCFRA
jgi:diguanylate cyclase (GGDEF)-like protein